MRDVGMWQVHALIAIALANLRAHEAANEAELRRAMRDADPFEDDSGRIRVGLAWILRLVAAASARVSAGSARAATRLDGCTGSTSAAG